MIAIMDLGAVAGLAMLLDVGLKGALLLAVAWLLALSLRRKSASARHMVWLLAVIALVALPQLRLPVLPGWVAPVGQESEAAPPPLPLAVTESPEDPEPLDEDTQATVLSHQEPVPSVPDVMATEGLPPAEDPPPSYAVSWHTWSLLLWAAGLLLVIAPLVVGSVQVWRLTRRARLVTVGPLAVLLHESATRLGLTRAVRLLESREAAMPMTCGVLRPAVLLPDAAESWSADRLGVVVLHELAHVRRRDCLTQMLARLACALYWFNPLVWIAAKMLRIERERACDDMVLMSGSAATDYADHLLAIVRSLRSPRCPAFAALAMVRRSHFEGRLLDILDPRRSSAAHRAGASARRSSYGMGRLRFR
jgi:beta-lactamase regulating signal transducer with metallopeptidase domain